MKLAIVLAISLIAASEAFSASHRHHTKKHHHQVRDGEVVTTSSETPQPSPFLPNIPSDWLCRTICSVQCGSETADAKRHIIHHKKTRHVHNKKHHSVRDGEDLTTPNNPFSFWDCECKCRPSTSTTSATPQQQPEITQNPQDSTSVNQEPNAKKHHHVRAHHAKHHVSKKNHH